MTSVSILDRASRGLLACRVVIDPSCPVFIACSMSRASGPRTSPTTNLSGRMRSDEMTRSRIVISLPSGPAGLAVDVTAVHDHDLCDLDVGQQLAERPKPREVRRRQDLKRRGAHWINLTADGHARRLGSARIARFPLPVMVAVHAITPPAMVA